ncbi:MAG TPA: flagellar hook-associated protein FlgL [Acidimicrobiales bacterium]|nr:flagellar hook-associated protein FlgL [Acidimicrobiales bacterium]
MERVTQATMHQNVLAGLQTSLGRVSGAQAQLASGKKINNYSDAPADASAAMRMKAEEVDWTSYGKAADDGQAWLNTQDSALQDATTVMQRVRELVVAGGSSLNDPTAREAMASEIDQLSQQLASIANTTYQGQSVFGGFASKAVAQVGGNWTWAGDNGAVNRRVSPDMVVQVNGNGQQIFGLGAGQTNVFAALQTISADLRAGNTSALSNTDLAAVDTTAGYIKSGLTAVGARSNVIDVAKTTGQSQIATLKDQRSSLEDADVAETALNMQLAQTGYQAALAAASRLSLPTLVDFLH